MQGEEVSKPVLQVIVSTVPSGVLSAVRLLCREADQGCSTFSSLNFILHSLGCAIDINVEKSRVDKLLVVDVTSCFWKVSEQMWTDSLGCFFFPLQNTRAIATGTGPPRYRVLMSDGVNTLSCEYDKLLWGFSKCGDAKGDKVPGLVVTGCKVLK